MKIKITVLLLTMLIILYLFWPHFRLSAHQQIMANQAASQQTDQLLYPEHSLSQDQAKPTKKTTVATPKSRQELSTDQYDQLLEQLSQRQYSEDIGVELISLGMEYESCGNNNWDWRFKDKELSEKQRHLRVSVENHCQKMLVQYPFLDSQSLLSDIGQIFTEFPTETPIGGFLQDSFVASSAGRIFDKTLSQGLIAHGIKAKNAQMIKMAEWLTKFRSSMFLFDQALLDGQDFHYLHHVQAIAITALSCDFQNGKTCAPTSNFMQDKCFENDHFCGMDFNSWYAIAVLPGMDADVQLVQTYLSQLPTP